jgi:hypothetical protein
MGIISVGENGGRQRDSEQKHGRTYEACFMDISTKYWMPEKSWSQIETHLEKMNKRKSGKI